MKRWTLRAGWMAAIGLAGCAVVSTRNLCEEDRMERVGVSEPRDCHTCVDDAECVSQGNVCEGVVYCAHRDVSLVSTDLGCHPEPDPPADESCICRDSFCQVR